MPARDRVPDDNHLRKFLEQRIKSLREHADRLEALMLEIPKLSRSAKDALYMELLHKIFPEE